MVTSMAQPDPTKVVGRRVVAAIIDFLIVLVPTILLYTANLEYRDVSELAVNGEPVTAEEWCDAYTDTYDGLCVNFEDVDDRVYYADDTGPAAPLYFWGSSFLLLVVLQSFTGWSPGKLILGLRVVQGDGRKAGFLKTLGRWALLIVDLFPYFIPGLTGFIVALSTPGHRRVGDLAAKTFVVKRASAGTPIAIGDGRQVIVGEPAPAGFPATWAPPIAPTAADPSAAGWAAPVPPSAPVAPAAPTPSTEGPQWDEARGTYIQWDPAQSAWMQWDDGVKAWARIPGQ